VLGWERDAIYGRAALCYAGAKAYGWISGTGTEIAEVTRPLSGRLSWAKTMRWRLPSAAER
jgi:hypothetical protein